MSKKKYFGFMMIAVSIIVEVICCVFSKSIPNFALPGFFLVLASALLADKSNPKCISNFTFLSGMLTLFSVELIIGNLCTVNMKFLYAIVASILVLAIGVNVITFIKAQKTENNNLEKDV